MFLFLSKLLPLFVYPLGLGCLLIVLALVLLWKRPRAAASLLVGAIAVLWLGSNAWVATWLTQTLEWQNLPPANLPNADAIVVLGGATRSQIAPRPWVDVMEAGDRILHGARLYNAGKAPWLILSGGRIDWKDGGTSESADMAQIAVEMGVAPNAILQDPESLNTYQNAINVKQILEQRDLDQVLLVTSAQHMPRSLAIFEKQGISAIAAPTDFMVSEQSYDELTSSLEGRILGILPSAENLAQTTRILKEYLGLVIYRLRGWL